MQHYPVSADFHGGDSWTSTGIDFSDYSRMAIQTRKQSGERRLSTPSWAVNRTELRELLAVYLEHRARIRPGVGSYYERFLHAQAVLKRNCKRHITTLDKLCAEYVPLKQSDPANPRLRELEIQIETLDTRIRLEQVGYGKTLAGIVYYYYALGLDSVGVAEQLKIKPPQVRGTLFRLHECWEKFHERELERQRRSLAKKKAWNRHKAGQPSIGCDATSIVPKYLAGMSIPEIALAVGYKENSGRWIIRKTLREAGVKLRPRSFVRKIEPARALELRQQGLRYAEIARQCGVSAAAAYKAVRTALAAQA